MNLKALEDIFLNLWHTKPLFGFELEFYVAPKMMHDPLNSISSHSDTNISCKHWNGFYSDLAQYIKSYHLQLSQERGDKQLEISSTRTVSVDQIVKCIIQTKQLIRTFISQHSYTANQSQTHNSHVVQHTNIETLDPFDPCPYPSDYGSSLQINISLHHQHITNQQANSCINTAQSILCLSPSQNNILAHDANLFNLTSTQNNTLIQRCIAGILNSSNELLYTYCRDAKDFARFHKHDCLSPATISWGYSNRTTAIRIPEHGSRRIEMRLPNANSEPESVLRALMIGMIIGLDEKPNEIAPTYCNSYDLLSLEPICQNRRDARNKCNIQKYIDKIKKIQNIIKT